MLIDNIQPTSESTNPMPHQQVNNKIYFLAYAYRARKVFYVLYIMFLSHAVFTMKYRGGPLSGGPPRASTVFESLPKHTVFLMEYCGGLVLGGPPRASAVFESIPKHEVFILKYRGGLLSGGLSRASTSFAHIPKHCFAISWRPLVRRASAGLDGPPPFLEASQNTTFFF